MRPRQRDFVLGLVVLGFLALFLGTFLFIYPRLGVETRRITVHFEHDRGVAPVKVDSPVLLSGAVQVGKVTDVSMTRLPKRSDEMPGELVIVVTAEVDQRLHLFNDCQITTDQPPVGGAGTVVILDAGDSGQPLDPDVPVHGLPPQSLAAAIGNLSRTLLGPDGIVEKLEAILEPEDERSVVYKLLTSLEDVNSITRSIKGQFDPDEPQTLLAKLHAIADNIDAMTAALRGQVSEDDGVLLAKLHSILDSLDVSLGEMRELLAENRPPLREAMTSVQGAAKKLDEEVLGSLTQEFEREDPASLLSKLHASLDGTRESVDNIVTLTETGKRLLVLNRPVLQRTIDNIKDTSDRMRTGIQEIITNPWRLMRPPQGEVDRLDVFEAARRFAEAAAALDDTAARLEAVVAQAPPDAITHEADAEIRAIQERLRTAFERFESAEAYLWERMK